MKNLILIVASGFFLFVSCDNASNSQQEIAKLKIETYFDSAQKKFPNYNKNNAIKDELNEFLKKDFKEAIKSGVINDLPFKLAKVEKCAEKYVLHLEHSLVSKLYQRGILNRIELDLYAYTDEKTAKSLQEEKFYLIEVDFKDYITHLNNEKYCAYVLTSPFMGYFDNDIQLGAIGVVANKITEVAK